MGRLAARNYAEEGYEVAAVDINEHGLLETAENHQNIRTFNVDVTNFDAVCSAVDEAEKELGPIRRALNAAAIWLQHLELALSALIPFLPHRQPSRLHRSL